MGKAFNPQEIIKIAIAVETNGQRFYEMMARQAKTEGSKDIWHYLAQQEEAHRKIFQHILNYLDGYLLVEFAAGEYSAYLNAMASEYIFTQELMDDELKENFISELDAIEFAIAIEKDSILTYLAFKEAVRLEKQEEINKIIEEEKRHLIRLIELKNKL